MHLLAHIKKAPRDQTCILSRANMRRFFQTSQSPRIIIQQRNAEERCVSPSSSFSTHPFSLPNAGKRQTLPCSSQPGGSPEWLRTSRSCFRFPLSDAFRLASPGFCGLRSGRTLLSADQFGSCLVGHAHQRTSKRFYGNAYVGSPRGLDVPGHLAVVRQYLSNPSPLLYLECKSNYESLRIVLFIAITSALALDLTLRPLRSSYWSLSARWKAVTGFLSKCKNGRPDAVSPMEYDKPLDSVRTYRKLIAKA